MPTCSSPTARCATWRRCSPTCERRRGSQRANRGSASSPPCANAGAHAPPWSRRYRCPTAASRPPAAHATSRSRASTDERGVATLAATPEPGRRNAMRMMKHCWLAMAVVLLAAGCASMGSKDDKLHEAQYAWSAAIRWGDFERSEEHTSELQSLMRISYAVFCLKKKIYNTQHKEPYKN